MATVSGYEKFLAVDRNICQTWEQDYGGTTGIIENRDSFGETCVLIKPGNLGEIEIYGLTKIFSERAYQGISRIQQ